MKKIKLSLFVKVLIAIVLSTAVGLGCQPAPVQHTFFSLFQRSDSLQVAEIWAPEAGKMTNAVGHHGPAVENQFMALRLYFDGRGAIDAYSKSGKVDNELGHWLWYPSVEQQQNEGAGCDEYFVGKTFGLGGVRLWDGEQEIRLETTAGRLCRVGRTEEGAFMEQINYGVPYREDTVDVSIRVDVTEASRWASVTVRELNGKPLRFATGINYPSQAQIRQGDGWAAVWGEHPADVSSNPAPIGGGIRYDMRQFPEMEDTGGTIRLVSSPIPSFTTRIIAASVKEDMLNTPDLFFAFVESNPE